VSTPLVRRLLPWLPSLAYMGAIWALSSQSQPIGLPDVPFRDKIAHGVEYGILAVLNLFALRRSLSHGIVRCAILAVLLTSAWGYLDELHQAFVPGRHSDVYDWVADTIGAIVFASVAAIASRARATTRADASRG
jgi:VanZ family protein